MMRRVRLVLVASAVTLTLAGCGSPGSPAASGTSSGSAQSATASASPTQANSPSPTATTAPPPPPAASPPCTINNLTTTYATVDNTAGHEHGVITFSNRLGTACSMNGYPQVWFDNPEAQSKMGAVASTDTSVSPSLVVLQPGGSLQAALTITQAGFVDGCTIVSATALLVSPTLDHEATTDAFELQHVTINPTPACQNPTIGLLQVGPVTAP